ncbi:hypothetical protein [Sphingomonas sp. BT-65]|nr:hypothetical protein [Sphingomonas sp. BT-65]
MFGTGTAWPDIAVALVLAGLGISGGWHIVGQAFGEANRLTFASTGPLA